jgi:hypothetical protein
VAYLQLRLYVAGSLNHGAGVAAEHHQQAVGFELLLQRYFFS